MIFLSYLIDIYIWIVIIVSLLSWIRAEISHPVVRFLFQITEPVFNFLRSRFPLQYQSVDFAPLVVVILLTILKKILF